MSTLGALTAIRKLDDTERNIILASLLHYAQEWEEQSEPLTPWQEDRLIDTNVLYFDITANQLSIDFPPPEG